MVMIEGRRGKGTGYTRELTQPPGREFNLAVQFLRDLSGYEITWVRSCFRAAFVTMNEAMESDDLLVIKINRRRYVVLN